MNGNTNHFSTFCKIAGIMLCSTWLSITVALANPTVVSMNLCTDRLVMALANSEQIVSLSHVAVDPNSMIKPADKTVKLNHGRLEELLALNADVIVASEYDDPRVLERLRGYGKNIKQFPAARTIEQAKQNIRELSKLLGHAERGKRLNDEFDALAAFKKVTNMPRTLLLGANSYISGKNTLASHIAELMGYKNIAGQVNIIDYGRVSIEQVIDLNPQVIIVNKYSDDYSRAQAVLSHPVLRRLNNDVKIIDVPTREWICGDTALISAAGRLQSIK